MRKTILIVEDSPFQANSLELILSEFECDIYIASDGKEAMEKLYDNNIDVAIVDNTLPDISGIDLCKKMISTKQSEKLIIILNSSEEINQNDILELKKAGGVDYVSKTENYKHLIEVIKKIL